MTCVVYWLFDARCVCPWKHGYIGITVNFKNRLKNHRRKFGQAFNHQILFRGSNDDCLLLEVKMRPRPFIGWNWAEGGTPISRAPKSAEHRWKMKEAALRRYADPAERTKMSEIQKGRKITWAEKIASGKRGLKPSDATRAKMSAVRKGKPQPPRTSEHCANIAAAKRGMKMPWIAESNRRRARKNAEVSP